MRIPVFVGDVIHEFVRDDGALRRYVLAAAQEQSNIRIERRKNAVIRIRLLEVAEDCTRRRSLGPGSMLSVYTEQLSDGLSLPMLKRYADGELVTWGPDDAFNPRRFNPDTLCANRVRALA